MTSEREMKKYQEEMLFDNILSREFLEHGKPQALVSHLEMSAFRLQNGMTAEEIDAVTMRAKKAYERQYSEDKR
ncbi:MAG: hypothetical protein FWF80_02340 [Defluviitaleaceae bacterium]|nr:hypothetical protein [Defluviitaleaceae bacterium]